MDDFIDNVDIMMIGHFAKDRIVVDGRGEDVPGGAVYYGSIALRRLGLEVAVVTRLHPDDFPLLEELKKAGVHVIANPAPETSGIENIYSSDDMEHRITHPLGFAGPFTPEDVPYIHAKIYAVVPIMAGEVNLSLLERIASWGPTALDVQGFIRVREGNALVFKPWPEMADGLKVVTYLKADMAEASALTGMDEPLAAARALSTYGPTEVVLTRSEGVLVYADRHGYFAPFTPRSLAGRTGRGDTCFATYLGKRLSLPPDEACRWAAAVTTLKQEKPGPWDGDMKALGQILQRTPVTYLK